VSLTLHPVYRTGCGGGWPPSRRPRGGPRPGWLLDGGWASCGTTPGAEPDPVFGQPRRRPANLGAQVRCHGLGITESQQPACTDASRFIQIADSGRLTAIPATRVTAHRSARSGRTGQVARSARPGHPSGGDMAPIRRPRMPQRCSRLAGELGRSQSRRRSTARSIASARDDTPSFW
jgi:hypothetical protein